MPNSATARQFSYLLCLVLLFLVLTGCGGNSNAANGNNGATPGTTNSGGTAAGGSGGSSPGVTNPSTGAGYLYDAIYTDAGGVAGFSNSGGSLTAVSGSPYIQRGSAGMGAMAATNGYIYVANLPTMTSRTQLIYYRADASSGALTQAGTADAGVGTNGDSEMRTAPGSRHSLRQPLHPPIPSGDSISCRKARMLMPPSRTGTLAPAFRLRRFTCLPCRMTVR